MPLEYALWILQLDADDPERKEREPEEFGLLVAEALLVLRRSH